MTTKQYLQQAFWLDNRINVEKLELERLRHMATGLKSSSEISDVVVQRSRDGLSPVERVIDKIVAQEEKINRYIDDLVTLKSEIREGIERLPDDELRLVLLKRYINFMKFEEIAVDLSYTYRHVIRLHGDALRSFDRQMRMNL